MRSVQRTRGFITISLCLLITSACGPAKPTPAPIIPPTPIPTPKPPSAIPGDYGDAPDGGQGMDTGYYGATGGPFFFTYSSLGTAADFPTLGDSQPPGPFTLDVDEFWIGGLLGLSSEDDVPSIEEDADDPNDPDQVPNLNLSAGKADCDKENGSHNPAGTGCQPVAPYSIPMNARVLVFFGYPPLGVLFTSVTASETMSYSGPIYWNLLIDLNQDGQWGSGEWISQDVSVSLTPGETRLLVSPAFRFPSGNTPWGRLTFPFWVRSMVTSERVKDVVGMETWDGRGVESGFETGEVEDYFVEWRPLGQRFAENEPLEESGCGLDPVSTLQGESQVVISPGDTFTMYPGNGDQMQIFGVPDMVNGGTVVPFESFEFQPNQFLDFEQDGWQFKIAVDDGSEGYFHLDGTPDTAPDPGFIAVPDIPPDYWHCHGTGTVGTSTGMYISVFKRDSEAPFGVWETHPVLMSDDIPPACTAFAISQLIELIEGSVHFIGDRPWVNVSGELEEDGSFYAEGSGIVAGQSNVSATFEGKIEGETLTGVYTMGAAGELTGGVMYVYDISGTYQGPSEESEVEIIPEVTPGEQSAVDSFVEAFNQAFTDQDSRALYFLLDPAVVSRYGEEACQAYLQTVVETPTTITALELSKTETWEWQRDGLSEALSPVFNLSVEFTSADGTTTQDLHLRLPGNNGVRWFTDCGDPLSEE